MKITIFLLTIGKLFFNFVGSVNGQIINYDELKRPNPQIINYNNDADYGKKSTQPLTDRESVNQFPLPMLHDEELIDVLPFSLLKEHKLVYKSTTISFSNGQMEVKNEVPKDPIIEEERQAKMFMKELNENTINWSKRLVIANWNFITNITDANDVIYKSVVAKHAEYQKSKLQEIVAHNYTLYKDEDLKRQFKKFSKVGYDALSEEKHQELANIFSLMEENYGKARICSYVSPSNCELQLEPELTATFMNSNDPDELKYYWKEWYDAAGTPMRKSFHRYIELNRESAILNNFTSGAESWLDDYEDPTLEQQLKDIYKMIFPFFEQLHAYVRFALNGKYGDIVPKNGSIPMHLLGNVWAQTWENVDRFSAPFPRVKLTDFNKELIQQNYTAKRMFELAENFYLSLNMTKMPKTFWERSIIEKPTDGRDMVCHALSSYFYDGDDVRIKQCTRVTMDDLYVVHHEMGHVEYFLEYLDQPAVYRAGANPGFHEAIGDTVALSLMTPVHLGKIGLLKDHHFSKATKLNQLYKIALQKITVLQFAYFIDLYRWSVFRGEVEPEEYNCHFWELREHMMGVVPPVQRYKEDFDPPAKFHISSDIEYLRYMVSVILQFQLHKGLCITANEYDPNKPDKQLSDCDIYGSAEAGNKLKKMLALGSSKPWQDALEIVTGGRTLDASAIMEYFQPLYEFLIKFNHEMKIPVGWKSSFECLSKPQKL